MPFTTACAAARRAVPGALSTILLAAFASGAAVAAAPHSGTGLIPAGKTVSTQGAGRMLVLGRDGALPAIERAVTAVGGTITSRLPIINGVAAQLTPAAAAALRAAPGVVAVEQDADGRLMSVDPNLGYDPQQDDGSLNLIDQAIGATKAWRSGYTGKGVDVALIDSGVSPVNGLTSGNVVNGPDLSFDSQSPNLTDLDGFGHGTHMAGIIAGRDQVQPSGTAYANDTGHYYGVAPDARVISVKVASADGSADVSQVIAAINWVDQHAHSDGLNIRVLNLSYGTNSTQDYTVDPLAYAAEQAWRHGIVVVASGGNDGYADRTLADPAYDPQLLAVGASDPAGTVGTGDDTVADFTSRGSSSRHVDLVAPGVHVLSLRDPGSYADQEAPSAVVGGRFFRGSGTSQAAAVVSGAVALLVQRYPDASPDEIKHQLMNTAAGLPGIPATLAGSGELQVGAAIVKPVTRGSQAAAVKASGTGSLEAARGGAYVVDSNGVALTGEQDIFGTAWNGPSWALSVAGQRSWTGGTFNGNTWTGNGFASSSWTGQAWRSTSWTSSTWSSSTWSSSTWSSHAWRDGSWDSHAWRDDSWQSSMWASSNWASFHWR